MSSKAKSTAKSSNESKIVGRKHEVDQLQRAIALGRNVLIEGPVGVGKTFLVQQILKGTKTTFERIDGDTRYTEQKLTGWFDPPMVLKKGYVASCFVDGPLAIAMKKGIPLFINELNRMPEAVQNILLPAMDERRIVLPKLGDVVAKPGFLVIATQNPREFTATHALSEAVLDRFEMVSLAYQSREEELHIVRQEVGNQLKGALVERAVDLVRSTRQHPSIKRGASLRAAIAICQLASGGIDFETGCLMALCSRIEMISSDEDPKDILLKLIGSGELPLGLEKKGTKSLTPAPSALSQLPLLFFPPELAAEREFHGVGNQTFDGKSDWIRTVYFQRLRNNNDPILDRELVNLVLEQAKSVVAHPSRPMLSRLESFEKAPFGELALEETLEDNPTMSVEEELLMSENIEKPFSCVTLLDASASMSGDKHLLASIAVAVLLLEVPSRDTSLVVFSSHAKTIKRLLQEESREATILRFLKVQPRGFTNIYAGLEEGLKQFRTRGARGRKVGLIATDGRSTEGGDPLMSAAKYDFLVVLHLHGPGSHLEASQEIAQKGNGICLEVERFEELPQRLYEAVRLLARL